MTIFTTTDLDRGAGNYHRTVHVIAAGD